MEKLENYQVLELSSNELRMIDGGWVLFVVGLVIGMVNDAYNNPDDFWAGYNAVTN